MGGMPRTRGLRAWLSCRLAPEIATDRGRPVRSVIKWIFEPVLAPIDRIRTCHIPLLTENHRWAVAPEGPHDSVGSCCQVQPEVATNTIAARAEKMIAKMTRYWMTGEPSEPNTDRSHDKVTHSHIPAVASSAAGLAS